jgi:hypothetical protein
MEFNGHRDPFPAWFPVTLLMVGLAGFAVYQFLL